MKIQLNSSDFPVEVLEAGRSLVKAYFPEVEIRVTQEQVAGIQNYENQEAMFPTKKAAQRGTEETGPGDEKLPGKMFEKLSMNRTGLDDPERQRQNLMAVIEVGREQGDRTPLNLIWRTAGTDSVVQLTAAEIEEILSQPIIGRETPDKLLCKHGLLKLLTAVSGQSLPWGILTGIRPTKIAHQLADRGYNHTGQVEVLHKRYAVRQDKAELLAGIAQVQKPYLAEMQNNPHMVAVYAGIPFCPSRCSYCSFPGYPVGRGREQLKAYLAALRQEIEQAGVMMKGFGFKAGTLYIGGGTPTVLDAGELENLLAQLQADIPMRADVELTVEAGRPDTLTLAKLLVFKKFGVTRLSINPQTMHNLTLQRIGRGHSVAAISEVYAEARSLSRWVINMDLILGLPGEGLGEVKESLEQIALLQPDNLTVHALALKRGSREMENGYRHPNGAIIEEMQNFARTTAMAWGLRPYYLYRQKAIAGNTENIGYAKPGLECRYNIGIMEERQSVIGLGAGAATKVVNPKDYSLHNLPHPADRQAYIARWPELHVERSKTFHDLFV